MLSTTISLLSCKMLTTISLLFMFLSMGSPEAVPKEFDCEMRRLALDFAKEIVPSLSLAQARDIADALNGSPEAQCRNLTVMSSQESKKDSSNTLLSESSSVVYVSSANGDDDAFDGTTRSRPVRTIERALESARNLPSPRLILLESGRYELEKTISITSRDENVTIMSQNTSSPAVVTGAKRLGHLEWEAYNGTSANAWRARVGENVQMFGLRVNGKRAIRARFPNADPERSLNPIGWITSSTNWMEPQITAKTNPPTEYVVTDPRFTRKDSTGNELQYQIGIGGSCIDVQPPAGYWCSARPNRTVDGSLTHRSPAGIRNLDSTILPNFPYKNVSRAVVHSCRGGANCWFTWMFDVVDSNSSALRFANRGQQGAEGSDDGGVWYVENVLEELDFPNEYYYDGEFLYYVHNSTGPIPSDTVFESVELKVLFDIRGNQSKPVRNFRLNHLTITNSAITYLDTHGLPSGGDWGLNRDGAAVRIEGTEGFQITNCLITLLDASAISINAYNRELLIARNEMVSLGESAITSWGLTRRGVDIQDQFTGSASELPSGMGIDGTDGNQPRGNQIAFNLIHEVGIYQKQSSMYFQAQSCQTNISNNIFYNGPRAHINFNDQFGGANVVRRNLIFNAVRETADHGPFNSWGRQPYITKVRDGKTKSITPAVTEIRGNFIIGSYNTQEAIDNDDASEYFNTSFNFFAYGGGGLKSDFGGHDNHHSNNVYAYLTDSCLGAGDGCVSNHENAFHDNRCVMCAQNTTYANFKCSSVLPDLHDNMIFTPDGSESFAMCGQPYVEWQKSSGADPRTKILPWPENSLDVLDWARDVLDMKS